MSIRKTNPFISIANSYVIDAPEPSNISYFWNFGSLLGVCLVIQLCTGIFLAMHYCSNLDLAFISVQHIMTEVNYGWLLRYAHSNGAGFFFIFVYLHMARGIYYGSYRKPRIALWNIGVIIFLLMIITAFMGYKKHSPKLKTKTSSIGKIKTFTLIPGLLNNNIIYPVFNQCRKFHNNKPTDLTNSNEIIKEILGNVILFKHWDNLDIKSVQENIKLEVQNKSGIYIIINKISKNFYIGSAHPNRLYNRFRSHLFNFSGSKIIKRSVNKYGLNNFIYGIFEYIDIQPIIQNHTKNLFILETSYISLLSPQYNILTEAGSSLGYKHSEETINKMKSLFTDERRELLRQLQINRNWTQNSKDKLREIALNRKSNYLTMEDRIKIGKIHEKIVNVFDINNIFICTFYSINKMCNFICCSNKTIKRAINKGYIYIPTPYLKYLNDNYILKYNTISEINTEDRINQKKKLKSGLLFTNNKTKVFISYLNYN